MSGSRNANGCWTCRLRKKKCDELHPTCLSCSSRSIPCYGYGAKPVWADGAELEAQMVRDIKRAAESIYRARRRRWKPASEQLSHGARGKDGLEGSSITKQDSNAAQLIIWDQNGPRNCQTSTSPSSVGSAALSPWRKSTDDTSRVTTSDPGHPRSIARTFNHGLPSFHSQQMPSSNTMNSI
jgi:Fungal Zn(2)-Cys(6) binuclear cluster domain